MPHFVITYNFEDREKRQEFVKAFEAVLVALGFHKESSNQTTFYGFYKDTQSLLTNLFNNTNHLKWELDDVVTIYYPKPTLAADGKNYADIGRHPFKVAGSIDRNRMLT